MDTETLEYLEAQVISALNAAAGYTATDSSSAQDKMDDAAHNLMVVLPKVLRLESGSAVFNAVCELALDVTSFDPAADFATRVARRDDAIEGTARLMLLQVVEAVKMAPEYATVAIAAAADRVLKRPVPAAA